MREIEVKILEVDRRNLEKKLAKLGAEKVFDGEIQTSFFDFEDGSISKVKDVLRLRKEQDKTELTYKKVKVAKTAKQAQEFSVEVSNIQSTQEILENLGLIVTNCIQKHRISYKLKDARFDFDQYEDDYSYIPEFMEIEAENIDLINRYAGILGFKIKDCLPWSTSELLKHYSLKEKNCKPKVKPKKI
jgi:adenylate cyclase, class 2